MAEEIKLKKLEDYKTLGENIKKPEEKTETEEVKKTETKKESKPAVEKAKSKKKEELKVELEREYIVPLRKKVNKVPRYRRTKKAIRVLREFLAKHMKVEDRDLNKIKIDKFLNQELWFRGMKKPPIKIKVKAIKKSDGNVYVELVDIPEQIKWIIERQKKQIAPKKTKIAKKEEKTETEEQKKEEVEKEKASVEAGLKVQHQQAKEIKHTSQAKHIKATAPVRKALKK